MFEIKPVNQQTALFAVKNWHYSRVMPSIKLVRLGVFEDAKFVGVVIFSNGASPHLGTSLGLDQTEICELTRVALDKHDAPVSQILAACLKILKRSNPGLRCVASFADPKEGHKGSIYQANNWVFTGLSTSVTEYFIQGRWRHTRNSFYHKDKATAPTRKSPGKFRYLFPLDKDMRRKVLRLALPYPHAIEGLKASHKDPVFEEQVRSLSIAQSGK